MEMLSGFPLYLLDMLYSHVLFALNFVFLLVAALVRHGCVHPVGAARTFCT
jgi:hypothetical protein